MLSKTKTKIPWYMLPTIFALAWPTMLEQLLQTAVQFQKILDSVDERKPMPSKSVKKKSKTSNCSQDSKPIVKKLDHGKICALFKAGWPPVKIADEMGCSPSTVTYHLQKEGLA